MAANLSDWLLAKGMASKLPRGEEVHPWGP